MGYEFGTIKMFELMQTKQQRSSVMLICMHNLNIHFFFDIEFFHVISVQSNQVNIFTLFYDSEQERFENCIWQNQIESFCDINLFKET